jgi:uncharacterized protein YhbP (UPF0306 family)
VAIAPFARRYSFFDGDRPAGLAAAMAKARIYRFIPSKVTFIDNSSGFASKTALRAEELPLPG